MGRLFGTDGVRGIANGKLTCDLAFKLGQAGAFVLTSQVHKARILIGRDTRISGRTHTTYTTHVSHLRVTAAVSRSPCGARISSTKNSMSTRSTCRAASATTIFLKDSHAPTVLNSLTGFSLSGRSTTLNQSLAAALAE